MSDQPYHNKGFGLAFITIILTMFILPVVAMMTLDDTFERFLQKYGDPIKTECWEKYTGSKGKSYGVNDFGKSAPYKDVFDNFNLNVNEISSSIIGIIND